MPNTPVTRQELLDAIKELGTPKNPLTDPLQEDSGPIKNPIDKYAQLPETTRDWLEGLRVDDLKEIDDVRRWFRNTRIITTFGKWLVVALVAALVGTGQVGKILFEVISFYR